MNNHLEKEFEEFYQKSPFAGMGQSDLGKKIKLAMYGSFLGGYNLATERHIEELKKKL